MATFQNHTKSIILLTTSVIFLIIGILCIIFTIRTIYYQIAIFTGIVTLTISTTTFNMAYKIRRKIVHHNSQNSSKYTVMHRAVFAADWSRILGVKYQILTKNHLKSVNFVKYRSSLIMKAVQNGI